MGSNPGQPGKKIVKNDFRNQVKSELMENGGKAMEWEWREWREIQMTLPRHQKSIYPYFWVRFPTDVPVQLRILSTGKEI